MTHRDVNDPPSKVTDNPLVEANLHCAKLLLVNGSYDSNSISAFSVCMTSLDGYN